LKTNFAPIYLSRKQYLRILYNKLLIPTDSEIPHRGCAVAEKLDAVMADFCLSIMLEHFGIVFLFLFLAFAMIYAAMLLGKVLRPNHPGGLKNQTYECGETPIGTAWVNFNSRFYIIALIFLLFDVEVIFIFPVAIVYKDWIAHNLGLFAMLEIFVFVVILIFALVYAWGRGDLNWVKTMQRTEEDHTEKSGNLPRSLQGEKTL